MQCPKCQVEQDDQNAECIRCGLIFEKYRKRRAAEAASIPAPSESVERTARRGASVGGMLFHVHPETKALNFGLRLLFFLAIFIWGLKFIFTPMETNYTGDSVWHLVNLHKNVTLKR